MTDSRLIRINTESAWCCVRRSPPDTLPYFLASRLLCRHDDYESRAQTVRHMPHSATSTYPYQRAT